MPKPADYYHSKRKTETIPEYFFIYDLKKEEITYLSDSFEKFRVAGPEANDLEQMRKMIDQTYYDVFDKIFEDINQQNYVQDKDLKVKQSDEDEKWVNIKTFPIILEDTEVIAGNVQDITKKLRHLQDLKKENSELEQIIHIMAHDLRGPLGSILNISEIQKNVMQEKDYDNAELYAAMIDRIVKEMSSTLKGMTEMIELKSDRFLLQKSTINIKEFIQSIVERYSVDMEYKGIEFYTSLPDHNIYIELDLIKFRLVIQNLLTNAIKFTKEGGKITLCVMEDGNDLIFSVSDTGIGIPEGQHEHIFEKFTKMKRRGTKGEKSTGLGLSIARKIIEVHQGNIEVRSKAGKGTTFVVRLPL